MLCCAHSFATYVLLVCRPVEEGVRPLGTRREFRTALRENLGSALQVLIEAAIAPVDLAQAAIGPGIAVFSRYSKVIESDGSRRLRSFLPFMTAPRSCWNRGTHRDQRV
jgi:putative DNA methylase